MMNCSACGSCWKYGSDNASNAVIRCAGSHASIFWINATAPGLTRESITSKGRALHSERERGREIRLLQQRKTRTAVTYSAIKSNSGTLPPCDSGNDEKHRSHTSGAGEPRTEMIWLYCGGGGGGGVRSEHIGAMSPTCTYPRHHFRNGIAREWWLERKQLDKHTTDRPNINGTCVVLCSEQQLGWSVPESHDGGCEFELCTTGLAYRAQISDLHSAIRIKQQVFEFDITMHDTQLMHVGNTTQQLQHKMLDFHSINQATSNKQQAISQSFNHTHMSEFHTLMCASVQAGCIVLSRCWNQTSRMSYAMYSMTIKNCDALMSVELRLTTISLPRTMFRWFNR
jgi:hypothetical protein